MSNLNRTTGQDGCRSTVQVNCRFIDISCLVAYDFFNLELTFPLTDAPIFNSLGSSRFLTRSKATSSSNSLSNK
ncbi:MAG: hypothetical protein CML07_06845 [Psychrobacter sp.]|nr:hypothetical protein [Psychrobacter sp.]